MKRYFGYIRVSDPRQGRGVSLSVQEAAIRAHALHQDIEIVEWFKELETAAAQGRGVFSAMLAKLKRGEAEGVVFHKIDRSARNLYDWTNIGKLFDSGVDVQFAHDNIDLHTRGGRLSADIQAVIAADFIRNHTEEVKKGFYGRLKQGVYPLPAPVGYLDMGAGKPKELDPVKAPMLRYAFELYASGTVGLKGLKRALEDRGLMGRSGKPMSLNGWATVLRNPFYIGLIRIERTGETFQGAHQPLVTKAQFDRVQQILDDKSPPMVVKHSFAFQRMIRCETCGRHLVAERHKAKFVYYRCHMESCAGTTLPERIINQALGALAALACCDENEMVDLRDLVDKEWANINAQATAYQASLKARIGRCDERIARTTDAMIDGMIDKEAFAIRNSRLLQERKTLMEELENLDGEPPWVKQYKKLELKNSLILGYESATDAQKRDIVETISSNFSIRGKNLAITLKSPYREIADLAISTNSGPLRGEGRTRARQILDVLKSIASPLLKEDTYEDIILEEKKRGSEQAA